MFTVTGTIPTRALVHLCTCGHACICIYLASPRGEKSRSMCSPLCASTLLIGGCRVAHRAQCGRGQAMLKRFSNCPRSAFNFQRPSRTRVLATTHRLIHVSLTPPIPLFRLPTLHRRRMRRARDRRYPLRANAVPEARSPHVPPMLVAAGMSCDSAAHRPPPTTS